MLTQSEWTLHLQDLRHQKDIQQNFSSEESAVYNAQSFIGGGVVVTKLVRPNGTEMDGAAVRALWNLMLQQHMSSD